MTKRKNSLKNILIYGLLIIMGFGVGHFFTLAKSAVADDAVAYSDADAEEFSPEALLAYMKELKIKYPETVLAQAVLETGNFTSDIFKENHNLFGMKVAGSRPTSAIGTNRNHAKYRNWKESVMDYALFQSFIIAKLPSNNKTEYRSYIQKFYSTTSDYLVRIDNAIGSNALLSSVSGLSNEKVLAGIVPLQAINTITSFQRLAGEKNSVGELLSMR